ncbi:X-box-binding protein 1 [Taenia crassiceps]|uniref:X-box-binding protein 1 n=1 Tax=Taenia crassiceps TaxID=6207 RepID=A0ABR4QPG3_9CEST
MSGKRGGVVLDRVLSLPLVNGNRKRSRLDYLTEEEKALRRKLLNREAAQKARDRKKDSIRLMEQSIRSLQSENRSLRQTISFLKHKCQEQEIRLNSMHYQLGLLTSGDQLVLASFSRPTPTIVVSFFKMVLLPTFPRKLRFHRNPPKVLPARHDGGGLLSKSGGAVGRRKTAKGLVGGAWPDRYGLYSDRGLGALFHPVVRWFVLLKFAILWRGLFVHFNLSVSGRR